MCFPEALAQRGVRSAILQRYEIARVNARGFEGGNQGLHQNQQEKFGKFCLRLKRLLTKNCLFNSSKSFGSRAKEKLNSTSLMPVRSFTCRVEAFQAFTIPARAKSAAPNHSLRFISKNRSVRKLLFKWFCFEILLKIISPSRQRANQHAVQNLGRKSPRNDWLWAHNRINGN